MGKRVIHLVDRFVAGVPFTRCCKKYVDSRYVTAYRREATCSKARGR